VRLFALENHEVDCVNPGYKAVNHGLPDCRIRSFGEYVKGIFILIMRDTGAQGAVQE